MRKYRDYDYGDANEYIEPEVKEVVSVDIVEKTLDDIESRIENIFDKINRIEGLDLIDEIKYDIETLLDDL